MAPILIPESEKLPLLLQTDYNQAYDNGSGTISTISRIGCAMVTMAAVLQYFDIDKTPIDLVKQNQGSCYMNWDINLFSSGTLKMTYLGVEIPKDNLYTKIKSSIDKGNPVIGWSDNYFGNLSTHFVIIYGYDDNRLLIRDPMGHKTSLSYDDTITIKTIRIFSKM